MFEIFTLQNRRFPTRIGITGSPGTGKKSVGIALAKITGLDLLLINDFAIEFHLGVWQGKDFLVNLAAVRKRIDTRGRIVSGHLLPYLVPDSKIDFVVVLRCSPRTLRKRYLERNYSSEKIIENLEAEMIGVVAEKAMSVYRHEKLVELDTTKVANPKNAAKMILETIQGQRALSFGKVDWLATQRSASALLRTLDGSKVITKP
jgi:adenylate kinase